MKKNLVLIASTFVALALSGCAASVKQTDIAGSTYPKADASSKANNTRASIGVVLTASAEVKRNNDWNSLVKEWQKSIPEAASQLDVKANYFQDENALPTDQNVLVKIKVKNFRYMTPVTRAFMGILAGDAYMDLDVEYIQLPSGQLLKSKNINTSSSAWEGIFSAVTPSQVQAVSRTVLQDARNFSN